MDPLSLTANVITVLQVANSILSVCYEVRAALNKAPWSLTRVLDEVKDLRNVLEHVERIAEPLDEAGTYETKRLQTFELLCEADSGPLARCHQELAILEKKIIASYGSGKTISKRRAFVQVMGWQLRDGEAKACLERIDRCKGTILLAMTADDAVVLKEIRELGKSLDTNLQQIGSDVSGLVSDLKSIQSDEENKAMTRWLAPVDSFENHEKAMKAQHIGTGTWFVRSKIFENWRLGECLSLWLSGFPGSGKTLLFSNIILSLSSDISCVGSGETSRPLVSFFYCDFRQQDTYSAINVVGSLVAQLCSQLGFCPVELQNAFEGSRSGNGPCKPPSFSILRAVLQSLSRLKRFFLLVDALDECDGRQDLLDFLADLQQASKSINILVTSREESDISDALASFTQVRMENYVQDVDLDIKSYTEHRLHSDLRLRKLQPLVKRDIQQLLNAKSAGMFRLVQCMLDDIAALRTVRNIRCALKNIPRGLSEVYKNILGRVAETDVSLVRKILLWLSFTVLPVTLEELHSAIAIEQDTDELDEDAGLASISDILVMCGSLISVTDEGRVQLAHLSVKDYLLSEDILQSSVSAFALSAKSGKRELAMDCFTYLSFRDFRTGPSQSAELFAERLIMHPFLRHASTAWTYYLRGSESESQLHDKITTFFSPENRPSFMSWVQVLNADSNFKWDLYPRHATPLYYAASFGLLSIVESLIDSGADLNVPGSRFGGTALHGAICRNHTSVCTALLQAGANPNQADFDNITPLHTASGQGNIESIQLLLQYGASKEARDRGGQSPLDWAVGSGYAEPIIDILTRSDVTVQIDAEELNEQVWKRRAGYVPDWYEKRSGMESSIVVAVTLGAQHVLVQS